MLKLNIDIEELLIFYFNGELDKKIQKLKIKKHQKWPDNYYNTLNGVNYSGGSVSNTNHISDPTGQRATQLADMSRDKEELYNRYVKARKAIQAILEGLTSNEVDMLQKYLDSYKDNYKAKEIINDIKQELHQ